MMIPLTPNNKSWQQRSTKADKKLTKAHPFRRRKPSSPLVWHFPFWRIRLCSCYRRLSQCEFASWSCRRLCLHSLQLEDVPQFLAIWAFFLAHDFNLSWIFSLPHFSCNRRVSLCYQTHPQVFVSSAILNVSYWCWTTSRGSFVKHGCRRVLLNAPAVWTASLIKSVYQNKF